MEDKLLGHWLWITQAIGCWIYKIFSIKIQTRVQFSHFIPGDVKEAIQKIGNDFFSQIYKIKQKIIGETDMASKK